MDEQRLRINKIGDKVRQKRQARYGVMGGTFNPIHNGHLVTAEEARIQFELDKVIFMPAGKPPHKMYDSGEEILSAEERYLMAVIATASNPNFIVSRLEVERPGTSYTIDTVRTLNKIYDSAKIFFITGADAVWEILTWKDPEKIVDFCTFIAATRPGYSLEKFKILHLEPDENANALIPKVEFMKIPALAISSTAIRRRIKEGHPIRYLVPEGVLNYIYKSGFYRG